MTAPEAKRRLTDWFLQWREPLRKFLRGRGSVRPADVDDIAQEVFLRLMRYDRAQLVEHPQAYLYKIASNVAAEWAIRVRYARPHDPKWLPGLVADDEPEGEVGQQEMQAEIERALLTLTPRQRQVLRLQFFEGLSRAETAKRLGATERSVKRALMKSYEELRNRLDPELLGVISDGRE
jgi:RNA polymerase sigma factor (sigma-70 family)